jgi:long-subunit fatty acid transport protein
MPFLARDALGARWMAMGGACIAAVDDGSALYMNPAGLAKIRRIELLTTFQKESYDIDTEWSPAFAMRGGTASRSVSSTRLRELALSFPLPTYRGSLVLAGSVFRTHMLDTYSVRQVMGYHDLDWRDAEETGGALTAWAGAIAVQVSPQAFVGFEAHAFTGDYDRNDVWSPWNECDDAVFDWDTDLGGYGASFGLQYQPIPLASMGLLLRSPQRITLKGDIVEPFETCSGDFFIVDDRATLPYSMGVGVAVMPATFLVTFDAFYTNWNELDYPGFTRDPDTDEYLYESTTDLRFGLEYTVPAYPLRFRAGYAHIPLELIWYDVVKNRKAFSLGAGAIIESTVAVDFAWQRTGFEREILGDVQYSEKRTISRIILTVAYRF